MLRVASRAASSMPRLPDRSLASRYLAVKEVRFFTVSDALFPLSSHFDARALTHHLGRLVLPLVDEDLERLGYALSKGRVRREALFDDLQRGLPKSDEPIDHLVVGGGVEDDGETSGLRDARKGRSVMI